MEKKKFEFKKISEDEYNFIMNSDDIKRVETVKKQFVKDHYKELQHQKQEAMNNLAKVNQQLEANKIEHSPELENFIALANQAGAYKKHMDTLANHSAIIKMLDNISESIESIEKVLPEVKRQKK
jgi:hypothetical protein